MKILKKEILAETKDTRITKLKLYAPLIAGKAQAGQFVVLMVNAYGERIPLTIVDKDEKKGTITLVFQEIGLTTRLLGRLDKGDSLYALVGPLGHATEVKNYGRIILVGGGVGIAEIYPVAKTLKEAGNNIKTIIGARTKGLLILEEELKGISDELHITTDDGTYGRKGFVTDVLNQLLSRHAVGNTQFRLVYTVGPIPMMKAVSEITARFGVKTIASLNALMVDATGMCGCCRVTVGREVKYSCVDGPEFDAHLINWEEFGKRSKAYLKKEEHICKLNKL